MDINLEDFSKGILRLSQIQEGTNNHNDLLSYWETFVDLLPESIPVELEGDVRSLLNYFVYCEYMENNISQTTQTGENRTEHLTGVSFTHRYKIIQAYNSAIELYEEKIEDFNDVGIYMNIERLNQFDL